MSQETLIQPLSFALYLGEDHEFLCHCFHYLAQQHAPLNLHFYSNHNALYQADIHMNAVKILYDHDYFHRFNRLQISWHAPDGLQELPTGTFIPTPDTVESCDGDAVLAFCDAHLEKIDQLEQQGLMLEEEHLQKILETPITSEWLYRKAWENDIRDKILELVKSEKVTTAQHPLYQALQHCDLNKHGFHFAWRKEIQEPALHTLMSNPEHEGAHLSLSLFKRYYPSLPESIKPLLQTWQNQHSGYLRIQPPLQEHALTYILTTYQRIEGFQRAAQHILNQNCDQWYFSIFDHGSGPEMQRCIEAIQRQRPERIQVYRQETNTGVKAIFKHLQAIIDQAPTELICFCADDDYVWSQHARRSLDLFKKYPWLGMVYSGKQLVSPQGQALHAVGPYYKQDQIINPHTELQRIIPMRSATPHFVARKAVFKALGNTDPYLPEDAEYGLHDTLSHIFAIALYEVGCTNEILSSVTLDNQSAFMQEDISSVWLLMAREVIQKYHALFEESFPIQPVQQLLKMLFENSSARLWQEWEHLENAEVYQQALDTKYEFYKEAFRFKQDVLPLCSATTPFLFQDKHPYAPL